MGEALGATPVPGSGLNLSNLPSPQLLRLQLHIPWLTSFLLHFRNAPKIHMGFTSALVPLLVFVT
jgi:hypothetical protein